MNLRGSVEYGGMDMARAGLRQRRCENVVNTEFMYGILKNKNFKLNIVEGLILFYRD